jgi:hypothetical protein
MPHGHVEEKTPKRVQLTSKEVLSTWSQSSMPAHKGDQPVLALGAAFWLYGFGRRELIIIQKSLSYFKLRSQNAQTSRTLWLSTSTI